MNYYIINGNKIVLKGIGKRFYQDGVPISITIEDCYKHNINVSMLHVADELLKEGWKQKTVLTKLEEEKSLDITNVMDMTNVKEFIFSDYETQREMIFNYLFKDENEAIKFVRSITKKKDKKKGS